MTPLEIEILLHYYACTNDYRDGDFSYPAVRQTIDLFKEKSLLDPGIDTLYIISERGRAMVEALKALPLPIWQPGKWVSPL